MANNKENDPSSLGGPAAGASTTSATGDSKMSKSTEDMKMQNSLSYNANEGLDDVVMGGCSTCGSLQHDTVKCDRQDAPSEYMMSGALQTDMSSSTCVSTSASATASATATPAEKDGEKDGEAQPDTPSGQDAGRRRSV